MSTALPTVPMQVFHAEVVHTEALTPAMRRIHFGGPRLAGYASTGVGDEYIRLVFPVGDEVEPPLPVVVGDNLDYASVSGDRLRTYTVRDHDPQTGRLTVDFVVHEGGVAAAWAAAAAVGDVIAVNTPTGMYEPPAALEWQVLVADCAGIPAALRILEGTPAQVRTRLVLEVADESHKVTVPEHPNLDLTWVFGGNGHGPSRLDEIVRTLPRPEGVGYLWVAGETKALRGVRSYLRKDLGLPSTAYKTVGYWTENAEKWRERYESLDDDIRAELDAMWESDRDVEEIEDEYDARLAQLGL